MKRTLLSSVLVVLAVLALLAAGTAWLLGTTSGARWAVAALPATPLRLVTVAKVQGRLWDRLVLSGVRVSEPRRRTEIDRLELSWQPLLLLSGSLQINDLFLSGVRVQDDTPISTKPVDLSWPRLPGVAELFEARVERLRITDLHYRHLRQAPVAVSALSASLSWRYTLLLVSGLKALGPAGAAEGEVVAGLKRPSLRVNLVLAPVKPVADSDLLSVQARLAPGKGAEQVAGTVTLSGKRNRVLTLSAEGEVGVTRSAVNLRGVRLERQGRRGVVTVDGSVDLAQREPRLDLKGRAAHLDLAQPGKTRTDLSGTVSLQGTAQRYRGRFSLTNRGPGWQNAGAAGSFSGTGTGARIAPFSAHLMDGTVTGELEVAWGKVMRVVTRLVARGVNPQRAAPAWHGSLNFNAGARVTWSAGSAAAWEVNGRLLQSRLQGKTLSGEVQAASAAGDVLLRRLLLEGEGVRLKAAGLLARRVDFTAQVGDLALLLPGARGALEGEGWLRWRQHQLAGALSGSGRNVTVAGASVAAARFAGTLPDTPGGPLHLDARLTGVSYQNFVANSATLVIDGTLASHLARARISAPAAQATLALDGGYREGEWHGRITDFSGRDATGPWTLAAPAPLTLAPGRVILAPLVLRGVGAERLELAGTLVKEPLDAVLRTSWQNLNLARANGWVRGMQLSGRSNANLSLHLLPQRRLQARGEAQLSGALALRDRQLNLQQASLVFNAGSAGSGASAQLKLSEGGFLDARFTSSSPARLAAPQEGALNARWGDLDLRQFSEWMPEGVELVGQAAGVLDARLLPGRRLEARGSANLSGGRVHMQRETDELDAVLDRSELAFTWQGGMPGQGTPRGRLSLAVRASASGSYARSGRRLEVRRCLLTLDADGRGTRAMFEVLPRQSGRLVGYFSSDTPAYAGVPDTGTFSLDLTDLDPAVVQPWMPGAVNLDGQLAGRVAGRLLPGKRLEMAGEARFGQGKAAWRGEAGEMKANLRSAGASFAWRGRTLTGTLSLALAGRGEARGSFELPLPARLPVAFEQDAPVRGSLTGRLEEQGVFSALFPGMVRESRGYVDVDLGVTGVWRDPLVRGTLAVARGEGYLPTLGIHVQDLQAGVRIDRDVLNIERISARSGPGRLEGRALVRLDGWRVRQYEGTISGERFQTIYLPEYQLLSSPQLTFHGDAQKLTVRGEVRIPELRILGPPARAAVAPSKDVIIEGRAAPPKEKKFKLALDGEIRVLLGDKVVVKAEGIDAQLGGGMDIVFASLERITSSGEIKVTKGSYRAYGLDLEIVRGRLYYAGGPIDQPTLDILALRTIGDVKAGVTVSGILREPIVKLYSEPAMPDVDVLAYMVLGHPLGSSTEQGSLVAQAAGVLFSTGQTSSLQEQIKSRLGLSTLGIQSVSTEGTGRMGYKEIPVTPTGAPTRAPAISQSMLTVGKYLTPKLYLSYGRSLFTGSNLFTMRYDVFRHWQVETQTGTESGVDVYYKIEFN